MSRINTLFRLIPDCVRQYLPCHYKDILILDFPVESLIFREPKTESVRFFDTIRNPENIVVLNGDIIVSGHVGAIVQTESGFMNYKAIPKMLIRNMCLVDDKILTLPQGYNMYLNDKKLDLEYKWIEVRCVCSIPNGFVTVSTAPVDVDFDQRLPGMIMFYRDEKYDDMVLTLHTWNAITWVGENEIAFAASRVTYGIAEIYLLSIDGIVLQTLTKIIPNDTLMGISVLYDSRWEEYIISGANIIIALSSRGSRTIFSNKEKLDYILGLCWNDTKLLACLTNKNQLIELS
jgi:hypothetical protein